MLTFVWLVATKLGLQPGWFYTKILALSHRVAPPLRSWPLLAGSPPELTCPRNAIMMSSLPLNKDVHKGQCVACNKRANCRLHRRTSIFWRGRCVGLKCACQGPVNSHQRALTGATEASWAGLHLSILRALEPGLAFAKAAVCVLNEAQIYIPTDSTMHTHTPLKAHKSRLSSSSATFLQWCLQPRIGRPILATCFQLC